MKKRVLLTLTAAMLLLSLAACGKSNTPATGGYGGDGTGKQSGPINVISREDGSGTRGAFIELFGVEEKDADGKKIDNTLDSAEITASTSVMMTTISGEPAAIGYISLGSLNSSVKALKIDGVAPSAAAVKDGSYTISRPFNVATQADLNATAKDFLAFIMSKEGQDVVEEKGYIRTDDTGAYAGTPVAGKITVDGSSSVTPVMEALKEAYMVVNPGAQIEIQQTDSTTGMNSAISGVCDIGMASRELKESELAAGLQVTAIALDGIVVAVNPGNTIDGLTKDQVKQIYTGALTDWSELN